MNSKIGNLARRRRKFLRPERATIANRQGASEDQKLAAKPTQPGAPEDRFDLWGKAPPKTNF